VTKRDKLIVSVLAVAVALAGYWFLLLSPKREEAAKFAADAEKAEQRRDAARGKLANAEAARASFGRAYAAVARMSKAVPADDDVASLVFQLEVAARMAKIDFRAVRLESTGASAPTAGPAQGSKPDPGSKGGDAATPPAGGATGATASGAPLPPGAVPASGGLSQLPFKLTFEGTFFEMQRFMKLVASFAKVKGGRIDVRGRLLTIDAVSLTPGRGGFPNVKAQITASAYLAPGNDKLPGAGSPATAPATPPAGAAPSAQRADGVPPAPPATIGGVTK
jgi:hypothetical protein